MIKMTQQVWIALGFLFVSQTVSAGTTQLTQQWMQQAYQKALQGMLSNISPAGAARGSVTASPSRSHPDYFYHWIRDAALTMDVFVTLLERAPNEAQWNQIANRLIEYVQFSRVNQLTRNPSGLPDKLGLGEPKFRMDGTAYWDAWGRPQNDGPALRASTLARFAFELIRKGKIDVVRSMLYDSKQPSNSVIKVDLEFVSHHWRDPSFDLWEEVQGTHFYTRVTQRKSLVLGAVLARTMGDFAAAEWYETQALAIDRDLERFWNQSRGYVVATLDRVGGVDYKHSGLDVAVVLGALHGDLTGVEKLTHGRGRWSFGVSDPRISVTANRLAAVFHSIYPINSSALFARPAGLGDAIGRYPEDKYDGYSSDKQGNPWFLNTNALAELSYRLKLCSGGDAFLRRTAFHMPQDFSMSEQMSRVNGYMTGANDLTWSYASLITTLISRADAGCVQQR